MGQNIGNLLLFTYSLRDMQTLLLPMQNDGTVDDKEFISLYQQYFSRNPDFPYPVTLILTLKKLMNLSALLNSDLDKGI